MEPITVHNSARRSWLIVLLAVVVVALALDLLVGNKLVAGLAERVYQGDEVLEARERVWGGFLVAIGGALLVWGVVSVVRLRPVLTVSQEGLHISLQGPFRPPRLLQWESIDEVFSQPVTDNGSLLSSLTIVLYHSDPDLPLDPWGARWTGTRILRVLASDWSVRPQVVSTVSNHFLRHKTELAEVSDGV